MTDKSADSKNVHSTRWELLMVSLLELRIKRWISEIFLEEEEGVGASEIESIDLESLDIFRCENG